MLNAEFSNRLTNAPFLIPATRHQPQATPQQQASIIMPTVAPPAAAGSPVRRAGSPKSAVTDFTLLSGEKLRLCVRSTVVHT